MLLCFLCTVLILSVRWSPCAICCIVICLILILGVFMLIIIVLGFSLLNQFARRDLRWGIKDLVVYFCLTRWRKSLYWFLMCFHWNHRMISLTLWCIHMWTPSILLWIIEILWVSCLKIWFFLWAWYFMWVNWNFSCICFAGKVVWRIGMSHFYLYFNILFDFNINF